MTMPCSNTELLRQYEEEQDRLEREAPTDAQIREQQEQMYWDRLHDLDALCDALSVGDWGDLQIELLKLIGQRVAYGHTETKGAGMALRNREAGRLLGELLESRLYPSPEDAEYALRNPE